MEDILYISDQFKESLLKYCSEGLLNFVFNDFGCNHIIINHRADLKASWVIDNYINERQIDHRKKLAVILSFAAEGGIVWLRGKRYQGDIVLLCALRENDLISEEDLDYFSRSFYDFAHGSNDKFTLNN